MATKEIWKFPIPAGSGGGTLEIPQGAEILATKIQRDTICVWAAVDPMAPKEARELVVVPTGSEFDDTGMGYIGTVMTDSHSLVFHVFERAQLRLLKHTEP